MNLDAIGIIYAASCSLIYNNVETVLEVIIYVLCLLADIACLIMLRKMLKDPTSMSNQQERIRDKILVMQNCATLAAIICSFIPYALYAFSTCTYLAYYGFEDNWNQIFLTYNLWSSLEEINQSSIKRVIGHAVDEIVTLFLQGRLAQIKLEETNFTEVVNLNQIPTNEGHQVYNKLLKLKEFFVQLFRR